MKRIIPYTVINVALLSFAFGQSVTQQESGNSRSEQEVPAGDRGVSSSLVAARHRGTGTNLGRRLLFCECSRRDAYQGATPREP